MPSKVEAFRQLGIELHEHSAKEGEWVGTCPLCGADRDRFGVQEETTQFGCRKCQEQGNLQTFARLFYETLPQENLEALAAHRDIDVSVLRDWGVVWNPNTDEYIIPVYRGSLIRTLIMYAINPEKKTIPYNLSGISPWLFATQFERPTQTRCIIAEGLWDTMKAHELVRAAGMEDAVRVIGVPGANSWQAEWNLSAAGKIAYLLYDNDHVKKHMKKEFIPSVQGMLKAGKALHGEASSVLTLIWGEEGFDPNLPSGYDVRDYAKDHADQTPKQILKGLIDKCVPFSEAKLDSLGNRKPLSEITATDESPSIQPLECRSFEELVESAQVCLYVSPEWRECLALCAATIFSTRLPGDQLWFKLRGPPGTGKCLGKGTPVLMFDGSIKPVEEVLVGDRLMGPDSKPRNVLSLARGREPLYRVVPVKGDSYVVNESHILSLKMSCGAAWRAKGEIVNIGVLDYISQSESFKHYAKGWRTGVNFPEVNVPLDPYLLGLWLGNGARGTCCLTILQPEVVSEMERIAAVMGLSVNFIAEAGQANTYSICKPGTGNTLAGGNPFRNALKDLGVFTGEKFVPDAYKVNSRHVRLEILAGLIDTDGHCNGTGYDFVSKDQRLAHDVAYLARSLGMAATCKPTVKTCTNTGAVGTYYRVYISGLVTQVPVRVLYKVAREHRRRTNNCTTGINLEPIGEGDYYGFEIDGDRLFLLGDFTVTHNTTMVEAFSCNKEHTYPRSHITGLNSGWKTGKNKSASLVPKMSGKCLIWKDADTLLNNGNMDTMLAEFRDLYDRVVRAEYRHGLCEVHENLSNTVILCGTDVLKQLNRAFLGDRFLDMDLFNGSKAVRDAYHLRAGSNAADVLMNRQETSITHRGVAMDVFYGKASGFLNYLYAKYLTAPLPRIEMPFIQSRIIPLAELLSFVRNRKGDSESYDLDEFESRREMAGRLVSVFTKLAVCRAAVDQHEAVGDMTTPSLMHVFKATGDGNRYRIIRALDHKPFSIGMLGTKLSLPETTVRTLIDSMTELGVVAKCHRRKSETQVYDLTPDVKELWTTVNQFGNISVPSQN